MSKIILAGGGDSDQSELVDEYFSELKPKMNMLFIPQAVAPKQWTFESSTVDYRQVTNHRNTAEIIAFRRPHNKQKSNS